MYSVRVTSQYEYLQRPIMLDKKLFRIKVQTLTFLVDTITNNTDLPTDIYMYTRIYIVLIYLILIPIYLPICDGQLIVCCTTQRVHSGFMLPFWMEL
jgi:hypothetical protein